MRVLYTRAMQLEAEFFQAQPHQPPAARPVGLLISDFDDTMVKGETTVAIFEAALAHAGDDGPGQALLLCMCARQ